ncbi:hypothetical protein BgiMline_031720 [Biomphalaria glabrata]|uniref:Uncharacterized protein LOC129922956 n=1 Tax=Biomphalaria glabrata TaxID=6526 RepID=A0A9W2YXB4_BIOGL|nr:uncharacterized protein LOC129922956 [Biomphalaria glabrata]KAI8746211.1 hypothetical protein BgiMline_019927 [Biomphalaria glabrata]
MAAAAPVLAEMDCPPFCESSKESNSREDTNQVLATKNKTCDPSSDFLNSHDICLKNTMDLCLTPLQSLTCTKGTAHSSFIDLQNFSVSHLPPCYQHKEMFNLVTALADLVIMVQLPQEENVYLQGTGKIDEVFINTNENHKCYCLKCSTSQNPSKEWGMIRIMTSANLLKGCKDATKYKCTLFFDEGEDKVVNLLGNGIVKMDVDSDYCTFFCISCDMDLVEKLDAHLDVFIENWSDAVVKYYPTVKCTDEKLIVIISHPHGCKKHISLGKWSKLEPHVEYDAAMCPGCSGSYLLLPVFDVDEDSDDM